jgi:hypothetical protein
MAYDQGYGAQASGNASACFSQGFPHGFLDLGGYQSGPGPPGVQLIESDGFQPGFSPSNTYAGPEARRNGDDFEDLEAQFRQASTDEQMMKVQAAAQHHSWQVEETCCSSHGVSTAREQCLFSVVLVQPAKASHASARVH